MSVLMFGVRSNPSGMLRPGAGPRQMAVLDRLNAVPGVESAQRDTGCADQRRPVDPRGSSGRSMSLRSDER